MSSVRLVKVYACQFFQVPLSHHDEMTGFEIVECKWLLGGRFAFQLFFLLCIPFTFRYLSRLCRENEGRK